MSRTAAILAAVRDVAASTPGLDRAHWPPPAALARFPVAVVDANEGEINPGGSGGDLEIWRHTFTIALFCKEGYTPEANGLSVDLMEAVSDQFRTNMTLGGLVPVCWIDRYTVGRLTYQGGEYTGATLRLRVEDKFEVDLS
jgi:hypothetical protein